ncbi:TPA: hypothetical protein ACGW1T_002358 [Raoultella ornithinolytica]|uniref:hypothetical protein n=1 Tax=Klebsiella TaxID=570 RepID=UPI000E2DF129|nr:MULTISPECIES: hypothetical protein [Klebsiella]MCW9475460.1 hypothetical protein [Klebsiella oxytoca]MCW9491572.1 hypothetical protein [Klebsiella oxytoca]SWH63194.1 Uncharacterised protein [Klebsiella pneumoniae]
MDAEYKIVSTTQATPGWWLMYEDEGKQFYYPVAAWAKCATRLNDNTWYVKEEWLYPMTPDYRHLLNVPVLDGSSLLYLPDAKFVPVTGNAETYYVINGVPK